MFDIGTGEVLALAVLALLVLGPDKLPRYAAEAARFLRQIRQMAGDARSEVRKELGPELDGIGLRELNPRALMRKHVLEGFDDLGSDRDSGTGSGRDSGTGSGRDTGRENPSGANGQATTPYDTEAT